MHQSNLAGRYGWNVVDKVYANLVIFIFNGDSGMGGRVGQKDECLIYCIG